MNTVAYRVLAKDSRGGRSGYTTSLTRTVTHNADPTVSGSDQALGVPGAVRDLHLHGVLTLQASKLDLGQGEGIGLAPVRL